MASVAYCGFLASHIPTTPWSYGMPHSVPLVKLWGGGGEQDIILYWKGKAWGGACNHIKSFGPVPFPHKTKIYTEVYANVGPISLKCAGKNPG